MKDQPGRRDFLLHAGGMASGLSYALVVHAPAAAITGQRSAEDISAGLSALSPATPPQAAPAIEPHLRRVKLETDITIAGGGMAGVCAALAAARHGVRVVLAQDRSRLGGNASSEVRMHMVGADYSGQRAGWREGGIIEELRLEYMARNPHCAWEMWDLMLYDKIISEPNITLLLDAILFSADVRENLIQRVLVRSDKTEHLYEIEAKLYADCTGDCRLGLEAGAKLRSGHEARAEFDEPLAPGTAGPETLGSSILFTSKDYGKAIPFTPPQWARKITREQLQFRNTNAWEYGFWWIEWGGQVNAIGDNERIRFELLSIVLGVWDYIKNSGAHPESANWAMNWIGMIPGKRASRRLDGPHLLTQHDCLGVNGPFPDAVAIGGWPFDDHPSAGFDAPDLRPASQIKIERPYNIPLRCLFSANIGNLLMAGRNISASHVAFTSTRVMATCSVLGQAMGTAAAQCFREGILPAQLVQDKGQIRRLQQDLLRDDQSILGLRNVDPLDLARNARVFASSEVPGAEAANIINGETRNFPGQLPSQWQCEIDPDGAWIELEWETPQTIAHVQLCFDSGFERPLTLTEQLSFRAKMVIGPQPELVRDYRLEYKTAEGSYKTLEEVTGNFQRLRRHTFPAVQTQALRLNIQTTHGDPIARIFEIRVMASPD